MAQDKNKKTHKKDLFQWYVENSTNESDESSKDTDSSENTQAKSKKRKGNDFFYLKKKCKSERKLCPCKYILYAWLVS